MHHRHNKRYHTRTLQKFGIINPDAVTTKQASAYLTKEKGIKTAASSLEVYRSQNRGPRFKRVGKRIFYTLKWLDEYTAGVEVHPDANRGIK